MRNLLAVLTLAFSVTACATEATTHYESDDAGNGSVEAAESTGFLVEEFGWKKSFEINGAFDSDTDVDAYSVNLEGSPNISIWAWGDGGANQDTAFPVFIDCGGGISAAANMTEPVLSGESCVFVVSADADAGYTSGEYTLTFDNLAGD
jgi:hypothetical protein